MLLSLHWLWSRAGQVAGTRPWSAVGHILHVEPFKLAAASLSPGAAPGLVESLLLVLTCPNCWSRELRSSPGFSLGNFSPGLFPIVSTWVCRGGSAGLAPLLHIPSVGQFRRNRGDLKSTSSSREGHSVRNAPSWRRGTNSGVTQSAQAVHSLTNLRELFSCPIVSTIGPRVLFPDPPVARYRSRRN